MKPDRRLPRLITRLYGETLRQGREKAGLSQADAAAVAGVSQKTVSNWETGSSNPEFKQLYALAEAYGCKGSELIPPNQYPSAPLDPDKRLDWVRRRNAAIQGVDEDEYMTMMAAQDERTRRHGDELKRS